jgi:hypothetical protein
MPLAEVITFPGLINQEMAEVNITFPGLINQEVNRFQKSIIVLLNYFKIPLMIQDKTH